MSTEQPTPKSQNAKSQQLSPRERFERHQLGKRNAVENNPDAIVFIPESPVARSLTNAIQLIDSADAIMRNQAGLSIDFKDFEEHFKEFQTLSETLEKTGQAMLGLIAKNEKIQLRHIRNKFTRRAIENKRKELKKNNAPSDSAKTEAAKEGGPTGTKKN